MTAGALLPGSKAQAAEHCLAAISTSVSAIAAAAWSPLGGSIV